MAVGVDFTSGGALVATKRGGIWTLGKAPSIRGDTNNLTGISCWSSTGCVAVGWAEGTGPDRALAERWDGRAWVAAPPVQVPSAYNGRPGGSQLEGVSCLSATDCIAVGQYFTSSSSAYPLAERWDGTSWVIQATPATHASIGGSPTGAPTGLESVQCTSTRSCMAVGAYQTSDGSGQVIAEQWNGSRWSTIATANESAPFSELTAVSCVSAASCIAVGDEGSRNQQLEYQPRLLVESWNGRNWVVQATP